MKHQDKTKDQLLNELQETQGSILFEPKEVELSPVINESVAMALEPAKPKGIEIITGIPRNLRVFADSNILQTVIRNLVSNAVNFTPKGGKISISAKVTGDKNIEISVQDTGIGMNQAMIGNLFCLDVQTGRKVTECEPSAGLGLLLCKEFIDIHGGKIWVESELGEGSKFKFTLHKTI